MIAFGTNQIRHLQLARARGRPHHYMGKQRPEYHVHAMLVHQFVHHLGPAGRVGAIVFKDDLDRTPRNSARIVHHLQRGLRPAPKQQRASRRWPKAPPPCPSEPYAATALGLSDHSSSCSFLRLSGAAGRAPAVELSASAQEKSTAFISPAR